MDLIREIVVNEENEDAVVIYRDPNTHAIIFLAIIKNGQPVFMDSGLQIAPDVILKRKH